jgi:hypothetical protein
MAALGVDAADAVDQRAVAAGHGPADVVDAVVAVGRRRQRLHVVEEMRAQRVDVDLEVRQPGEHDVLGLLHGLSPRFPG